MTCKLSHLFLKTKNMTEIFCHPERSEGSREHKVDVTEIFRTESSTTRLPPCGRLNDKSAYLSNIFYRFLFFQQYLPKTLET